MDNLTKLGYDICKDRYFWNTENTWSDLSTRLSIENAKNEKSNQDVWASDFYDIINSMDFIPAGRILRNLGKTKPSTSNCNFIGMEDSIESIGQTIAKYMTISAYGGGTGLNPSVLRPKDAEIKTRGGKSSGMLSFLEIFDFAGKRIESGGSRRSAGIALCVISHPEVLDFIDAKSKHDRLNQFNISVVINDAFIKAVENNEDWEFRFSGKTYGKMKAKDLWDKILNNMLAHGEPGIINWDNLIKNNTYYFSQIEGVNPCGELPLENLGVCNLGSLVLPHFISNKNTNWQKLSKTIKTAVRFMDNIIDLAYYPIEGQEQVVKNARRTGIGTTGLADYLFMKEIRYGSDRSLNEIEKLYKFIRDEAYIASVEIAIEKGAFPKYDKYYYNKASFIKKLPPKLRMFIKENSIRNSVLLTCPPTGTTSMLAGVTSGIEPLPFKGYRREDGIGTSIHIHPLTKTNLKDDWFVDSYDLNPEEHLDVQLTIQKYIDNSVSKTIILPNKTTSSGLSKLLLEYVCDLKGITVYRDGSREKQIYYKLSDKEIKTYIEEEEIQEQEIIDVNCEDGTCEI